MAQNIFKLVLTDEAQNFIESLPEAVSYGKSSVSCPLKPSDSAPLC